jgi:hypothetical protein
MLVLEAMLEEECLPGAIRIEVLAARFQRIADRSPVLRHELAATMQASPGSLEAMLRSNPLRAWAGTKRGTGSEFFELVGDRFATKFGSGAAVGEVAEAGARSNLAAMVRELVEWRLAEYLERPGSEPVEAVPEAPAAEASLAVGQSYMREDIPPLFRMQFNRSTWQQGIVRVPSGLVLLVTLDKQGKPSEHKYQDRFLSREQFQWQSQNQTTRDNQHGQLIQKHVAMGKVIHLFVRKRAKRADSTATPFWYCGSLTFERWEPPVREGKEPITVWWRLKTPLSDDLAALFVPRT